MTDKELRYVSIAKLVELVHCLLDLQTTVDNAYARNFEQALHERNMQYLDDLDLIADLLAETSPRP